MHVPCPEYVRLLQHYVAALRRLEQIEAASNRKGFVDTSAKFLAAEVKRKAQNERDGAKMMLNRHKHSCPVCLNLTNRREQDDRG